MRLNKFIASATGKSRREADDLIAAGRIRVNGEVARLGQVLPTDTKTKSLPEVVRSYDEDRAISPITTGGNCVPRGDGLVFEITLDGKKLTLPAEHTLIMLHKPVGYVSSRRAQARDAKTLYELLPPKLQKLKTVGRLDRDSSGLILLTDDGDFAFSMTHPKFAKMKIYEVELDKPLEPLHQQMISDFGIDLPDGKSKLILEKIGSVDPQPSPESSNFPDNLTTNFSSSVSTNLFPHGAPEKNSSKLYSENWSDEGKVGGRIGNAHWRVIMHEGRNRQIRRTFAALGYTVKKLHRTDFGDYHLNDLPAGQYLCIEM